MPGTGQQTCYCCGWSKVTTYRGLRIHQGKMGCTPKGMTIPESAQIGYFPRTTYTPTPIKLEDPVFDIVNTPVKSAFEAPPFSYQTVTSVDKALPALDFSTRALQQQVDMMLMSRISTIRMTPPSSQTPVNDTKKTLFETPPLFNQTFTSSNKARRALDFSTAASQVEQLTEPFSALAEETVMHLKKKEKEKAQEAEKLLQVKQDRMKADLQEKILTREQKIAEVSSSVETCRKSLDSEWLEINTVFSEVIRVVEDARQKALQPVEKRRNKLKREAQKLVQKLQMEIDRLKDNIDELEKNQDFQVFPLQRLDETNWENERVDSSFSFGTLRAQTSAMMKEIQQKLENLSSLELKRIPTFAVDIKLDSATAHQCLVLSDDGKKVRDGGPKLKATDDPERFDMFGSVLGLNKLNSGKSYWEVEVNNKTGWDLGVARRSAKRKGTLAVNTDSGYWVVVHYEGSKYAALTVPPVSLPLKEKPQKVGVFVDYEEGLVSFYNVTTQSHIYSFTACSFDDEIVPYFSPHLKQNDKNADPLIISAVQKQQ